MFVGKIKIIFNFSFGLLFQNLKTILSFKKRKIKNKNPKTFSIFKKRKIKNKNSILFPFLEKFDQLEKFCYNIEKGDDPSSEIRLHIRNPRRKSLVSLKNYKRKPKPFIRIY